MVGSLKPQEALDRTAAEWAKITERHGREAQLKQYQSAIGYKKQSRLIRLRRSLRSGPGRGGRELRLGS